jgi:hypothetical protein
MPYCLPEERIQPLSAWMAAYIAEQRAAFHSKAASIGAGHKQALQAFFPADVLNNLRVVRGRAPQPAFYQQLRAMGIGNAPAFSGMAGVTFQDVVVHVEALTIPLLFHELVHAVQYKHLGLQGFADAYVRGFLTGGSYEEIPLEKQAYELEARFSEDSAAMFSVENDVRGRIQAKRF